MQTFHLQPFEHQDNIFIKGDIHRNDNQLSIKYQLSGELNLIDMPPSKPIPSRQDELWQHTCFECFIGIKGQPNYWEFNISPSGDWNVYSFDGYRTGMSIETAIDELPFSVQKSHNLLNISLNFDLATIISQQILQSQTLEVAITTITKDKQDSIAYWALTHSGDNPDFHIRESFVIAL